MRPKDENGKVLAPAHQRLANAGRWEEIGVFEISKDGRSAAMPLMRKLTLVRKVIDHMIDQDAIPKWVSAPDSDRPDERALMDFWRAAEQAIIKDRLERA